MSNPFKKVIRAVGDNFSPSIKIYIPTEQEVAQHQEATQVNIPTCCDLCSEKDEEEAQSRVELIVYPTPDQVFIGVFGPNLLFNSDRELHVVTNNPVGIMLPMSFISTHYEIDEITIIGNSEDSIWGTWNTIKEVFGYSAPCVVIDAEMDELLHAEVKKANPEIDVENVPEYNAEYVKAAYDFDIIPEMYHPMTRWQKVLNFCGLPWKP